MQLPLAPRPSPVAPRRSPLAAQRRGRDRRWMVLPLVAARLLGILIPEAKPVAAHPPFIQCGPNIGGNASFYYSETWCTGSAAFMFTQATLYKYDGTYYNNVGSEGSACVSPIPTHICFWDQALGANGNGSGYYAVEGNHTVTHGRTGVYPSYIEFYVN